MSGNREPTDWEIVSRWWKALDESNAETRGLRLALRIIFMFLVLALAANVAFADVYAYSSASDCDADRDANPKVRYVATYVDEWALIADKTNNYTFYSLGGEKCFRVSAEHRATLDGALTITGTRIAIGITASGLVVAQRIKAAVVAVAGWIGWDLLPGDGPSQFTIDLAYSTAAERLRDPCKAIVTDLASNDPTGWGGTIDYSGMYSDCLKDNPVTTGPANRVEIPRPTPPGKKTVSEILADLDSLTKEEWDALSEAEQQQVIDALELLAAEEAAALAREDTADHTLGRTSRFLERLNEWRDKRDRG